MAVTVKLLKEYVSNDFNVLLIGKHGVGKTAMLKQASKELGAKLWMANASTMDPATVLTGIPVVNEDQTSLKIVRPREIDEAEVIFIDEINRATPDITNALMELINERCINGERLKNLRCVIAAMNPDDQGYDVQPLDPAKIDRFDAVLTTDNKPVLSVLTDALKDINLAVTLFNWHKQLDNNAPYVSPRRLESLGRQMLIFGADKDKIKAALGLGTYPITSLVKAYEKTKEKAEQKNTTDTKKPAEQGTISTYVKALNARIEQGEAKKLDDKIMYISETELNWLVQQHGYTKVAVYFFANSKTIATARYALRKEAEKYTSAML